MYFRGDLLEKRFNKEGDLLVIGTFEGEHTREGELSVLVLKREAYLKREPIRDGVLFKRRAHKRREQER